MKTFTQYLAEAVKEIPVRIKLATDLSDDMVETIESELARYDVVNVAKPVKTIVQEHPLDFGTKIRNAEVVIIDATIRMPMSFETFRRNLSDKLAIPYDYVVVKGENDPLEGENELEVNRSHGGDSPGLQNARLLQQGSMTKANAPSSSTACRN